MDYATYTKENRAPGRRAESWIAGSKLRDTHNLDTCLLTLGAPVARPVAFRGRCRANMLLAYRLLARVAIERGIVLRHAILARSDMTLISSISSLSHLSPHPLLARGYHKKSGISLECLLLV